MSVVVSNTATPPPAARLKLGGVSCEPVMLIVKLMSGADAVGDVAAEMTIIAAALPSKRAHPMRIGFLLRGLPEEECGRPKWEVADGSLRPPRSAQPRSSRGPRSPCWRPEMRRGGAAGRDGEHVPRPPARDPDAPCPVACAYTAGDRST